VRRFIVHHGRRHPAAMGAAEAEAFLTDLAVAGQVAASTQNQARSALLFLYKEVLGVELPWLGEVAQAKKPKCLPLVLTEDEARGPLYPPSTTSHFRIACPRRLQARQSTINSLAPDAVEERCASASSAT
jgi:hypothetical protein